MSEADRIFAEGVVVRLAGGEHRLRFTFRGLRHIERRFGSTDAAVSAITGASQTPAGTIVPLLAAGLLHSASPEQRANPELLEEELFDQALPTEAAAYLDAILDAFAQAFPPPPDDPGKAVEAEARSLGASGTTSPPSVSVVPTPTSATG